MLTLTNCSTNVVNNKNIVYKKSFINKGFALVYSDNLFKKNIIKKKLDNRSLSIIQKNIKKGKSVRVKNITNNKFIIAKVIANSKYPGFNNSVISERIAEEIELNPEHPYVEIFEILENSSSLIKKTKTFDEEKNVATKAPVDSISINDLNSSDISITKDVAIKYNFNFIIKIADFYFKDTAIIMVNRIKKETNIKNPSIDDITNTKYRVFLGPYSNLISLQNAFNDISMLKFENLEIIKNEK